MKTKYKVILGIGVGLFAVAVACAALQVDRIEADAAARGFLRLLNTGAYEQAQNTLGRMEKPLTVQVLENWWSICTRETGHSTRIELSNSFVKSRFIGSSSSAHFTYSMDVNGSSVPVRLTVAQQDGAWVVTNFDCGMTPEGLERWNALMQGG